MRDEYYKPIFWGLFTGAMIAALVILATGCAATRAQIDVLPDMSYCIWLSAADAKELKDVKDDCENHDGIQACLLTASDGRRMVCASAGVPLVPVQPFNMNHSARK